VIEQRSQQASGAAVRRSENVAKRTPEFAEDRVGIHVPGVKISELPIPLLAVLLLTRIESLLELRRLDVLGSGFGLEQLPRLVDVDSLMHE
jgi:hypothetical protein